MKTIEAAKITPVRRRPIEFGCRCKGCNTFNTLTGKGPFKCLRCDRPLPVEAKPIAQPGHPILAYKYVKTE